MNGLYLHCPFYSISVSEYFLQIFFNEFIFVYDNFFLPYIFNARVVESQYIYFFIPNFSVLVSRNHLCTFRPNTYIEKQWKKFYLICLKAKLQSKIN